MVAELFDASPNGAERWVSMVKNDWGVHVAEAVRDTQSSARFAAAPCPPIGPLAPSGRLARSDAQPRRGCASG